MSYIYLYLDTYFFFLHRDGVCMCVGDTMENSRGWEEKDQRPTGVATSMFRAGQALLSCG